MSTYIPLKMSQFGTVSSLTTGSFIPVVESGSAGITNNRISRDSFLSVVSSSQWVPVPANSTAPGSLGHMAVSGTTLYLHNGTNWVRLTVNVSAF
jgi:hypothetical protein